MLIVNASRSQRQVIFRDMVLGTLLYSVVLGFFNDYTNLLQVKSYSILFATAIVMQVLTYYTFGLKNKVVLYFKGRDGSLARAGLISVVWLVVFTSKFVYLEVIDFVFGDLVYVRGFVGLLLIVLVMTLAKQLVDYIYDRLAS